ncbi:hypothetical protein Nmel_016423, partial [Mimus melanotis]
HSVDLSKGCVIIRFSDWPQLPMQARADKSRRANPGAQLAEAAGGQKADEDPTGTEGRELRLSQGSRGPGTD